MDNRVIDLLGKPYKAHGRGPEAYDCWGLAMAAFRILKGQNIPDYNLDPEDKKNNAALAGLATNNGTWTETPQDQLRAGLLVAFQLVEPGHITHVGVTVSKNFFIQSTDKKGVTIEPMARYKKLVEGYYEYTKKG